MKLNKLKYLKNKLKTDRNKFSANKLYRKLLEKNTEHTLIVKLPLSMLLIFSQLLIYKNLKAVKLKGQIKAEVLPKEK
jgi:hypothetical protein